jgi:hypothetical protein
MCTVQHTLHAYRPRPVSEFHTSTSPNSLWVYLENINTYKDTILITSGRKKALTQAQIDKYLLRKVKGAHVHELALLPGKFSGI